MKKIFILTLLLLPLEVSFSMEGLCREKRGSLFLPKLPEVKVISPIQNQEQRRESTIEPLPEINIQGIVWGTDTPQAVIDGEVYRVGDNLKVAGAKITEISKDGVEISYFGNIYKLKIERYLKSSFKKEEK
jgi:type II secretory pathway component PulC